MGIHIQLAVTLGAGTKGKVGSFDLSLILTPGWKMDMMNPQICPNCSDVDENARHILFKCSKFKWPWKTISRPDQLICVVSSKGYQWSECDWRLFEVIIELWRLHLQRRNVMRASFGDI